MKVLLILVLIGLLFGAGVLWHLFGLIFSLAGSVAGLVVLGIVVYYLFFD